jgi:hypothetical protein
MGEDPFAEKKGYKKEENPTIRAMRKKGREMYKNRKARQKKREGGINAF